jgi:hypothetical protein
MIQDTKEITIENTHYLILKSRSIDDFFKQSISSLTQEYFVLLLFVALTLF